MDKKESTLIQVFIGVISGMVLLSFVWLMSFLLPDGNFNIFGHHKIQMIGFIVTILGFIHVTYIIWIAIFHIAGRKKILVYCVVMTLLFFGCSQLIMSQGYIGGVVIGCIVGVFIAGTAGLKGLDR
ncbi:hypothetical protein BBP95_14575 [Listeria monocytogenes]|nr:hypothetical protein [Listeria monocytogenes]